MRRVWWDAKHAVIRLWDTQAWQEVAQLAGHLLTVVQMEFSADDSYLASVSRDRHLSIWERDPLAADGRPPYRQVFRRKAHGRIIWSCSWSPDGRFVATGSRDKKVKIWRRV